ncbi:uncharacterized protein LOC105834201 [Monomorium pharaonis]|uniref:uncharacterized protein LOC105834201 n=1 Tax=Monomorium pharaonis TaxID=307658 RepID=UPI00063F610C|nr:uncharacterized protein LOC105834201 [Monomorium pharaonis]
MSRMETRSSSNENIEPTTEDTSVAEKKKKLLREIQDLKCIIKQCEWSLQALRFKDVENRVTEKPPESSEVPSGISSTQQNAQVDLQTDMYRFAGFHCIKFRRDEFIFNFTSTNGERKDNTYAIQIFIKDKKAHLGKWVMPMSIDMNYLLSKTPIDNLKNLPAFIKSCKHNVDCYTERQEQFLSLKECISHMKHCTLQSDIGFRQINLELYGVHDTENDRYINLITYLLYHSDRARPYKIEFNTTDKSKLNDNVKQRLKICMKEFKKSDLLTAFDKILKENSTFTWVRTDGSESPLELNNTSSSDEEDFLTQLQSNQKRSLRKVEKKRQLQKKWNERKRQRITKNSEISESSEDDREDNHSKAKVPRVKNPRQIPTKKKTKKATTSTLKQKNINKNLLVEITPLLNPKVKLKQTKLNFETREVTNSNTNEISLFESKSHNRSNNSKQSEPDVAKLITSTPLHHKVDIRKGPTSSPTLERNNIASIATQNMANKLNVSRNDDQLSDKKTPKKKTQGRTNRLLRSHSKTIGLLPQVLKTNQRLTRSLLRGHDGMLKEI